MGPTHVKDMKSLWETPRASHKSFTPLRWQWHLKQDCRSLGRWPNTYSCCGGPKFDFQPHMLAHNYVKLWFQSIQFNPSSGLYKTRHANGAYTYRRPVVHTHEVKISEYLKTKTMGFQGPGEVAQEIRAFTELAWGSEFKFQPWPSSCVWLYMHI